MENENLVFSISIEDLQYEAQSVIGRSLNEEEIEIARKGLEFGLLTGIDIVYRTIFFEMISQ